MKIKNFCKLIILANTENEAFARSSVAAFCAKLNPTIEQINDIKTSVSEAVTNCIVHGYANSEGEIQIVVELYEESLEIKIVDYGCGFENVERAMQPFYTSKPNDERSGMGFTLMQAFMDDVTVYSEINRGTTVILKKNISNNAVA